MLLFAKLSELWGQREVLHAGQNPTSTSQHHTACTSLQADIPEPLHIRRARKSPEPVAKWRPRFVPLAVHDVVVWCVPSGSRGFGHQSVAAKACHGMPNIGRGGGFGSEVFLKLATQHAFKSLASSCSPHGPKPHKLPASFEPRQDLRHWRPQGPRGQGRHPRRRSRTLLEPGMPGPTSLGSKGSGVSRSCWDA